MPLFSIIIPTLNEEKYVRYALGSASIQDVSKEIIVVDGGSEDKTVEIAEEYGAKVVQADRAFIAYQKNIGAEMARGKYLLFLDADTFLFPFALEELREEFETKEAIVVKFWLYGKESWVDTMNALMPLYFSLERIMGVGGGACFAIKKKVFTDVGMFPEVVSEDAEMIKILRSRNLVKTSRSFLAATSARRFEKKGLLRTFLYYTRNNLSDRYRALRNILKSQYEMVR